MSMRPCYLCSVETPAAVWRLYLARAGRALRAEVVDRIHPGQALWRGEAVLVPGRGDVFSAALHWRDGHVRIRVRRRRRRIAVRFWMRPEAPSTAAAPPSPARPPGTAVPARLERIARNPILAPIASSAWQSLAVFNAAAIDLEGCVHFFYRAVGQDGISVFGHAASRDGMRIDERSEAPVFIDRATLADYDGNPAAVSTWRSGPSLYGCEDPRITRFGDRLYMTYTAFDGVHPPDVALTSIAIADVLARRWRWSPPTLISTRHEAHKNWVLFPALLQGRIALMHGISPSIQVEYLDGLDFTGRAPIRSHYGCSGQDERWDNRIRGVGPPPLRTAHGWLLLYHAMDRRDPDRYKLGAMLLDPEDPARVLGRLPHPLLEPDARYENEGCKHGVVYACGAVLRGDQLQVYYGGADTVVCAATVSLSRLLAQMQARPAASAEPAPAASNRPARTAHAAAVA